MLLNAVRQLILRDLRAVGRELALYPDDFSVWRELPGVPNTTGTLVLHLSGNLQHFVGAVLGGSGYVRQRELEFSRRGESRELLAAEVERTIDAVSEAMAALTEESLGSTYPTPVGEREISTGAFLVHLATHLAYHLGQIDYHRRMVTGDSSGVDAVSVKEMAAAVAGL